MILALLAALASAPAPVAGEPAAYEVRVHMTHGAMKAEPRIVTRGGQAALMQIGGPDEGWSLKVTPTQAERGIRLALDMSAWTRRDGAASSRKAVTEVVLAAGQTFRLDLPQSGSDPGAQAQISVKPV